MPAPIDADNPYNTAAKEARSRARAARNRELDSCAGIPDAPFLGHRDRVEIAHDCGAEYGAVGLKQTALTDDSVELPAILGYKFQEPPIPTDIDYARHGARPIGEVMQEAQEVARQRIAARTAEAKRLQQLEMRALALPRMWPGYADADKRFIKRHNMTWQTALVDAGEMPAPPTEDELQEIAVECVVSLLEKVCVL